MHGNPHDETLLHEIPTSYKGRFRPLDAMSKLWLADYYHQQSIKTSQLNQFHAASPSALSLMWKIQFCGYKNWSDAPFFWVYSADLKALLDLPLNKNHFSYDELQRALYENKKSNQSIVQELITNHFLKSYLDGSNRSGNDRFELQSLSPGLWVAIKEDKLVVLAAPQNKPWNYLETGTVISDNIHQLRESFLHSHQKLTEEILNLMHSLNTFSQLQGPYAKDDKLYMEAYEELRNRELSPQQIEEHLAQEFPLKERLQRAGTIFIMLPGNDGEWYSLNALTLNQYSKELNAIVPISNFTPYANDQFEKIRHTYFKLTYDYSDPQLKETLAYLLMHNYQTLAGSPIKKAWDKTLYYPSILQLQLEYIYYQIPLVESAIAIYGIAILLLAIGLGKKKRRFKKIGTFFVLVAFTLNALILGLRCFILGRPPISNMFETVIYVPWIAVLASLVLSVRLKNYTILLAASVVSVALLVLLKITGLSSSMENVQAVLDSQFWLIIHVLMVVGSYGVFALAGILGQFYLWQYIVYKHETYSMHELGYAILQSMYVGVALLIPGTILGGVWAAQSWGRFWDWDPKESWAFISSCLYIIFIHAYTFKHIRFFGLAMGSVLGLLAISFTWYGVNYILGTGLHSYGFGSGGELYYYLFVLIELCFLIWAGFIYYKSERKSFERK